MNSENQANQMPDNSQATTSTVESNINIDPAVPVAPSVNTENVATNEINQVNDGSAVKNSYIRKLHIKDLISLCLAIISFVIMFIPWATCKVSMQSYFNVQNKVHSSMLGDFDNLGMFKAGIFYGLAKVFMIVAIVLLAVYLFVTIVDVKKLVPELGKVKLNLNRIAHIAYFGCYALVVVLCFLGTFGIGKSSELKLATSYGAKISFYPFVGWYLGLIIAAGGLFMIYGVKYVDKLLKINKENEN